MRETSPQEVVTWLRNALVHHVKRGTALRGTLPLTHLVFCVSPLSLNAYTSGASKDQGIPVDGWQGDRDAPVFPSVQRLGSRKARTGPGEQHATYGVPFASAMVNTGDVVRDGKASGQEAREPPTTRHGPHAESAGAEESARGQATSTRRRTDGEGPSPATRPAQRDLANAQADHGAWPVE